MKARDTMIEALGNILSDANDGRPVSFHAASVAWDNIAPLVLEKAAAAIAGICPYDDTCIETAQATIRALKDE
jgi:hypothetical protein